MIYHFYKDDKEIKSVEANSLKEAEAKSGIRVSEADGTSFVVDEKKARKPRVKKEKEIKSRKQPEYFIFSNNALSESLSRTKALELLGDDIPSPRIIMGHEIYFTRKVSFKQKEK